MKQFYCRKMHTSWIFMIKHAICSLTSFINPFLFGLYKFSIATINTMGQNTFFVVSNGVVEK